MEAQAMKELGALFADAGHQLFLVGGSVRDMVLGHIPQDWDFTTDALPDETKAILGGWADAVWDTGSEFGTIPAQKDGVGIEITTFRSDGPGRKPQVAFTDDLIEDLQRRDFTVNAMAMRVDAQGLHSLPAHIVDPFGGIQHLARRILDTPRTPEDSFGDDPLRMMRAARFAAQLDIRLTRRVELAMKGMADRIADISAERIAAELDKLIMAENPFAGWSALLHSGLLKLVLPEFASAPGKVAGSRIETRWADAIISQGIDPMDVINIGKRLKWSTQRRQLVSDLVAWVQRFGLINWAEAPDSDVRRLVAAAGEHLDRLQALLDDDHLSRRTEALIDAEGHPEPLLTGKEILEILNVKPGPIVGEAQRFLWGLRLEAGPLEHDRVKEVLAEWVQAS